MTARERWVYLIGSYEVRPVKIGVSDDPETRLKSLRTGSPVPLQLIWKTRGNVPLEDALHEYFAPYRIYGEWFDFGEENPLPLVVAAAARLGHAEWPARCKGGPVVNAQLEDEELKADAEDEVDDMAPVPGLLLTHPPEVVAWFASQSMGFLTDEERDGARRGVIAWVRREIATGRESQRSAGRILGVSKTTIANWLGRGPGVDEDD